MGAIAYALQLLQVLPSLISAGRDVVGLVSQGSAALKTMAAENRDPTDEEWTALNALIEGLQDELHKD